MQKRPSQRLILKPQKHTNDKFRVGRSVRGADERAVAMLKEIDIRIQL